MRNGSALNFLLNDHLGSTSVMLKSNGAFWGEVRYAAWGETRYSNGTIVTDRQYTGQLNDGDTGLYYYNARYYDPALHKFIQADTIVPDPADPQTLNRYAYVNNNPLKYTDPTGHMVDEGEMTGTNCTIHDCAQNAYYTAYNQYHTFQDNNPRCKVNKYCVAELGITAGVGLGGAILAEGAVLGGGGATVVTGTGQAVAAATTTVLSAGRSLVNGVMSAFGSASADGDPTNEGQAVHQGFTRLYRAVGEAEYQQIVRTGRFEQHPDYMAGKWFAESAQHAQMWGERFSSWDGGKFTVLAVDLPNNVANSLMRYASYDGIGPARYAEMEQLVNAIIRGAVK